MRKKPFVTNDYYHIFNRGTDKRVVFLDNYDLGRFLQSMEEFNSVLPIGSIFENSFRDKPKRHDRKLVDLICYCLNPNHYHLLLEQKTDGGISEFMKRLGGGYANYFNIKHNRSGALFQGKFKSVHIDSNEYLLHLSAYINLNNRVHKIRRQFYRSSWEEYLGEVKNKLCNSAIILDQFKNTKEYRDFAESSLVDILRRKNAAKEIEPLLLE